MTTNTDDLLARMAEALRVYSDADLKALVAEYDSLPQRPEGAAVSVEAGAEVWLDWFFQPDEIDESRRKTARTICGRIIDAALASSPAAPAPVIPESEKDRPWKCRHCGQMNFAWANACGRCERVASPENEHEVTEDKLWKLLPKSARYLDPPDGGDVPLIEQLRRMSEDASKWVEHEAIAARTTPQPNDASAASDAVERYVNWDEAGSRKIDANRIATLIAKNYPPRSPTANGSVAKAIARMNECRDGAEFGEPFYADFTAWDVIDKFLSTGAGADADWVLVPREPTEAMLHAAMAVSPLEVENGVTGHSYYPLHMYRAMLASSPQQRAGDGG